MDDGMMDAVNENVRKDRLITGLTVEVKQLQADLAEAREDVKELDEHLKGAVKALIHNRDRPIAELEAELAKLKCDSSECIKSLEGKLAAAAELEAENARLKAVAHEFCDEIQVKSRKIVDLKDALARERSELAEWHEYWGCESPHDTHVQSGESGYGRQLGIEQARANRLETENLTLRDGLEAVASSGCCETPGCCEDDPQCDSMIARAALAAAKGETT